MYKVLGIVFAFIAIGNGFSVFAQTQDFEQQMVKLKNVIPPSPEAASLGKFGDIPISLYRGIPEVTIPIYELKGRSISVPVSLSYHASGIKVGEISSNVGIGWSLQAVNAITRSVKGIPDEIPDAGLFALLNAYANPFDLSFKNSSYIPPHDTYVPMVYRRVKDSEPDLFYMNALGRSYTLYFGPDGSVVTQPYSNLKIKTDFMNKTFTVLLEDGTKLNFGGSGFVEKTVNPGLNSFVPTANMFVSTWYLRSIQTPLNEAITFTYSGQTSDFDTYYSETDYLLSHIYTGPSGLYQIPTLYPSEHFETQTVYGLTLDSIKSELANIIFTREATEREDMPGNYALGKIRIYSKELKKDVFEYRLSHFYSTGNSGYTAPNKGQGKYLKRLVLDYVQQFKPGTNIKLKEWKLDYNPKLLPSRGSYGQDHWGYFNGAANPTLLPQAPGFDPPDYGHGNREPNRNHTQAQILTKITYPTGGSTSFQYEQNSYQVMDSVWANGTIDLSRDLNYDPNDHTLTKKTATFNIYKPQSVNFIMTGFYSTIYRTNHNQPSSMPQAWISGPVGPISGATLTERGSVYVYLKDPGTYTLSLTWTNQGVDPNDPGDSFVKATVMYDRYDGYQNVTKLSGGVRIASIKDHDGVSPDSVSRYFKYEYPLVMVPVDIEKDYISLRREDASFSFNTAYADYRARYSNTLSSLGAVQGGAIAYGKVTTLYGRNGESGRVESYFSNEADSLIENSRVFPFPPSLNRDNRRGQLIRELTFDRNGLIKKKDSAHYTFIKKWKLITYKAGQNKVIYTEDANDIVNYDGSMGFIHYSYYPVKSEQTKQDYSSETLYDDNGLNPVTTIKNYFYDTPGNLKPTRVEMTDSKGNVVKTVTRTALEKSAIQTVAPLSTVASVAIDSMIRRNIIDTSIQKEQYTGSALDSRSTIDFKILPGNKMVLPEYVRLQIQNNPEETRVQFIGYDKKGNLLEQRKAGDAKNNYLYDYSDNYPIAEVINADTASIAYTSFESTGKGKWNSIAGSVVYNLNAPTGRKYLNNGSVIKSGLVASKKYIISFWYSGGSVSVNGSGIAISDIKTRTGLNGWRYREMTITGTTSVTVSSSSGLDEIRIYPVNARMTTYTYDPLIGVRTMTDDNGFTIYYLYDDFGRLKYTKDADGNVLKNFQYHYVNQN